MGRLNDRIKKIAHSKAHTLIDDILSTLESHTVKVTGMTRAGWGVIVDGEWYDDVPSVSDLKNAKKVQIRNKYEHISDLNERDNIVTLTEFELQYFIQQVQRK